MDKYCCIFGHSDFYDEDKYKAVIKNLIIDIVENKKIYNFLLGGYGNFDSFSARCIRDLKKDYPQIKSFLVLAYMNKKFDDFDKEYISKTFNETIYPSLENVPPRYAILKRNEWMINTSDFIIFFVDHRWGGAYKSLQYAKRKHKDYINIGREK